MQSAIAAGRRQTFFHALAFVIGFTIVFVVLGASVAYLGALINPIMAVVIKVGGILLLLFGLQVVGVLGWVAERVRRSGGSRNAIGRSYLALEEGLARLMYTEGRVQVHTDPSWGYVSSAMMGVFFSAGWIPCVGPVLAAIYMLASNTQTAMQGALLLLTYSIGLGIPFLITGAAFGTVTVWLRRMNRHLDIVSEITGMLLLFVGIMLFDGRLTQVPGRFAFFIVAVTLWSILSRRLRRMKPGLAAVLEPAGMVAILIISAFYLDRLPLLLVDVSVQRLGAGPTVELGAAGAAGLNLPIAFVAGLLSFLSPCVLPLIPAYIGYLSGTAVAAKAIDDGAAEPAGSRSASQESGVRA
jgi:cytochrome c-type biogenesis protein